VTELSNAALAAAIGITERRVAAVKAEGRLPLTQAGKVDGNALLRLGWGAALRRGAQDEYPEPTEEAIAKAKGLGDALLFTGPMERGFATMALLLLHVAPVEAAVAAAVTGIPRAQAEAMADTLLGLLWGHVCGAARSAGLPEIEPGEAFPCPDTLSRWRETLKWPGLYDDEGRSVVAAATGGDGAHGSAASVLHHPDV